MHILLQYGHFETPEEMLEILCQGLREKVAAKHEQLNATHLTSVRNWGAWLADLDMGLSNCWANRDGLEAAHSFSYKLYQQLSTTDLAWLSHEETLEAHPMDIYCCIKAYMYLGKVHIGFRMHFFWHAHLIWASLRTPTSLHMLYIYIYPHTRHIYIERERERERESTMQK
jgi:hypothetical protein